MHNCILHLGTNKGSKIENLYMAEEMISSCIGIILESSHIYISEAWGKTDQENFLNRAHICKTSKTAESVLDEIHIIEKKFGRVRKEKWGPRIIDIDIIFYGNEIIKKPHLIIPHPQLTNRNFVLKPLLDICPDYIHPELLKSIKDLNRLCFDSSKVERIEQ